MAIEHGHIVQSYEQELQSLGAKLLEMGGLAERLLSDAVSAMLVTWSPTRSMFFAQNSRCVHIVMLRGSSII